MQLQHIFDIAEACARHGVQQAVLSPGSRCAPLTLAFARHPRIQVRTVSDERAAAFIGLGLAQVTRRTTVLVCTSGTAALNYAPAVAEAFYQQLPLLVLTADRPPEWIDQLDGQTIRQENVYGRHVKRSFTFPLDFSHPDAVWQAERILSEALLETQAYPPGPVHLNVPLREPFYPAPGEKPDFGQPIKIIAEVGPDYTLPPGVVADLQQELKQYRRILVVAGQGPADPALEKALSGFSAATGAVVVADVISNLHRHTETIRHQDIFLSGRQTLDGEKLHPDLVITFGLSNISKNLKLFLRAFPARAHWHLQPAGAVADPFQTLTRILRTAPAAFFSSLAGTNLSENTEYQEIWRAKEARAAAYLHQTLSQEVFNEFTAFRLVMENLPQDSLLHVANSMSVRYANIVSLQPQQSVEVFANRGTSGIDGCTSTAVGAALATTKPTILLTGDLAFFYDRNGLWHNYLPPNLRIVVFNNHAGGIFRLIEGPRQQPELEEFFETRQPLEAAATAQEFNLAYYPCRSVEAIKQALPAFWAGGAGILEIITDSPGNAAFFEDYKKNSPFREN